MFSPPSAATVRRPAPYILSFALLAALGWLAMFAGPAAQAQEARVALSHAVPSAALLRTARLLGRQAQDAPVSAALTLPLRNQNDLHDLLLRIYDPQDPLYGHYLTGHQFTDRYAPSQSDYNAVVAFARAQGLTVRPHAARTLVGVSGTSGAMERAFGVRLNQYRTAEGRIAYANDAAPLVPVSIASRLSGIVGLNNLSQPRPHLVRQSALLDREEPSALGSDSSGGLTPTDIKTVYNLAGTNLAGEGQKLAVVELDGYNLSDISAYVSHFNLPANLSILSNIYTNGFNGAAGADQAEVVLDIDMMLALAPRASNIFVYEAPNSGSNLLELYTEIADDNLAQSISTSWGQADTIIEAQSLQSDASALFNAEDAAFEKMAAQGQSFFDASGDLGAKDDGTTLSVDDPAQQPYVTAVGGTTLAGTSIAAATETAWSGSGGGFSNFFRKPFYQYRNYSATNPTGPIGASPTFRDLPDVSINADPTSGYAIFVATQSSSNFFRVGGTSAAAPLWAALIALTNEARAIGSTNLPAGVSPGLPAHPVGFVNPLVYAIGFGQYGSYANDFRDITTGSNGGYTAGVGFDDVTGWGSFNGINLLTDLAQAGGSSVSGPTATVTGTVTFDGAMPPNNVVATITATSSDGVRRGTVTSNPTTGTYSLTLPSGLTYTLSADASGYIGQAVSGITLGASGAMQNFALVNSQSAKVFGPGLQMISAPFDFTKTGADFAALFGLTPPLHSTDPQLILWQSLLGYVYYPTPPADTLRAGTGYWLRVPASSQGVYLHRQGSPVGSPYTIALQAGWNQIGDPFTLPVSLANVSVATDSRGTDSTSLVSAATMVSPILYTYPNDGGKATSYTTVTQSLQPYAGYWIYALQPVYLTFTDPSKVPPGF